MARQRIELKDFRFYPSIRPKGGSATMIDACDVVIYPNIGIDKHKVVILTDTDTGMSVTNGAEYIIDQLVAQRHADRGDIFIEHYPSNHGAEDTFDIIGYSFKNYPVTWHPFSHETLDDLILEGLIKFEPIAR